MNYISRGIWFILNILFGALLASILFYWVACDMQIPMIVKDVLSSYAPILYPLVNLPYVEIMHLSSSIFAKLIFNAFLYAIFGFIHTLFAQEFVQTILGKFLFPKQTLRTVYCIIVTVTVFIIIGFWQHTHVQLWNFLPSEMNIYQQQLILLIIYSIIYAPGWYVIIKFNPYEFCGVKQLFDSVERNGCPYSSSVGSKGRTTGMPDLVTSGLFRFCRHPLYFFTILAWTITPVMSLDRLAIIIYTCLYATIGLLFEERKLVDIFGQAYIDYQQRVPAIIPYPTLKIKQN